MNLRDLAHQAGSMLQIKAETATANVSYATNGIVFAWGAISFNQIMMFIGTVFAVATYFTTLYFQRQRNRREREFHEHRMQLEMQNAEKAADRAEIKDWRDEDRS